MKKKYFFFFLSIITGLFLIQYPVHAFTFDTQTTSALQRFLILNHYSIPAIENGTADFGFFGPQTEKAYNEYLSDHGASPYTSNNNGNSPLSSNANSFSDNNVNSPPLFNANSQADESTNQTSNTSNTSNASNGLPFGGPITLSEECDNGTWDTVTNYASGAPNAGAGAPLKLLYVPGATRLYQYYTINAVGICLLGTYMPGGVCEQGETTITMDGTMIMVGTNATANYCKAPTTGNLGSNTANMTPAVANVISSNPTDGSLPNDIPRDTTTNDSTLDSDGRVAPPFPDLDRSWTTGWTIDGTSLNALTDPYVVVPVPQYIIDEGPQAIANFNNSILGTPVLVTDEVTGISQIMVVGDTHIGGNFYGEISIAGIILLGDGNGLTNSTLNHPLTLHFYGHQGG